MTCMGSSAIATEARAASAVERGRKSLRVYAGLIILGRVWLEVQFLLSFLLRCERGAFLRLRELGAVSRLRSGTGHRSAVLVGGARWGH